MRKFLLVISIIAASFIFNSSVLAAAWYVPSNVRIVQKSNIDTRGRIYDTIQDAINSITDASAANPYVVKVMPGIYDLGTASVLMKAYVSLEGSGAESTIITSSSTETVNCLGGAGTIKMADNSVIKNLTIKTTTSSGHVTGIAVDNVKGIVDGVTIITSGKTGSDGICITGPEVDSVAEIEVRNTTIESTTSGGQANAVYADRGASKMRATKSRFTAFNNGGSGDVINFETAGGLVIISDSVIEAAGTTPTINYILNSGGGDMTLSNSKILGSCKFNVGNSMKIATSIIERAKTPECDWGNPMLKFVSNFDENFNPIPNQ